MRKLGYREASNLLQNRELLQRLRIKTQASFSTGHAKYINLTPPKKKMNPKAQKGNTHVVGYER